MWGGEGGDLVNNGTLLKELISMSTSHLALAVNMTVAEIQGLLASISTANSKVGDKLKYWKSRLLAGLEATKKYHSLRAAFSSWLKEKGSLLGSQMDTSGTLEGVKEQLRDIQVMEEREDGVWVWVGVCVNTYNLSQVCHFYCLSTGPSR